MGIRIYSVVLAVIGCLLHLGGSPYYVLCGITLITSSVFLFRRRAAGAWLYGCLLLATLTWAIWEVGYDPWALMPRVLALAMLGIVLAVPGVRRSFIRRSPPASYSRSAVAVAIGHWARHAAARPRTAALVGRSAVSNRYDRRFCTHTCTRAGRKLGELRQ